MCVCVWEHIHSNSALCAVPEFLAAAALDDGYIKEEFIAIFHIMCNKM